MAKYAYNHMGSLDFAQWKVLLMFENSHFFVHFSRFVFLTQQMLQIFLHHLVAN